MRLLVALLLVTQSISGCMFLGSAMGDRQCRGPFGEQENAFHLSLPENSSELDPVGYCVQVHIDGEYGLEYKVGKDGTAWIPIETSGTYGFFLVVPENYGDSCAAWFDADDTYHPGTGVIELEMSTRSDVCY